MNSNSSDTCVFWFRRDLRLHDNHALYKALNSGKKVIPLFVFDKHILEKLDDKKDLRLNFIYEALIQLNAELKEVGSTLITFYGLPEDFFKNVEAHSVYANHDYEPYARERDEKVTEILGKQSIEFKTFKDQVIFEKDEIVKNDGTPYTVYTPYANKWRSHFEEQKLEFYPSEHFLDNFEKSEPKKIISLEEMGFERTAFNFPKRNVPKKVVKEYADNRNFPAIGGTTKLSVHLRFGTVSIRKLTAFAAKESPSWLNELIWRNFYMVILWHFPHVVEKSFKAKYDNIQWRNNEDEFKAWCDGKTGYPIVDAGMRELNSTGFMHNRVRMITASFLTKHLLIDWRWGEAYFAKKLLDFELASNNGGWQWASGGGCDAAPYFRVFNPELQTKKFDKDLAYIRKWVPEFQELNYPKPIVDHKAARERALKTYKEGLN